VLPLDIVRSGAELTKGDQRLYEQLIAMIELGNFRRYRGLVGLLRFGLRCSECGLPLGPLSEKTELSLGECAGIAP
jgi:hypothetical protein